jgi:serine/threonine protein kinase, bacterial
MKNHQLNALLCAFAIILLAAAPACKKSNSTPTSPTGPSINFVTPGEVQDSTIVTIKGTDFGTTQGGDAVFFNGKQAVLISASDTQLVAMVPTLAGSGKITVTANGTTITGPVFLYDTTYRISTVLGGLDAPHYLSIDASGNLIVPTYGDGVVNQINGQGVINPFSTVPASDGTAIDATGNLYVVSNVNAGSSIIYKVSAGGVASTLATDPGLVFGLAIDAGGNLYAGNNANNSIDKITPQGTVSVFVPNMPEASGVVVASDGNIYATTNSDPSSLSAGSVVRITPSGTVTTVTSGLTFCGEDGITIDGNNTIYVTSFNQLAPAMSAVVKIIPMGVNTSTNVLLTTNVYLPVGITIDKTGNLYVVNNNTSATILNGNVIKMTIH